MGKLAVLVTVSLVDQAISEDSKCLVDPEVDQGLLALEVLG